MTRASLIIAMIMLLAGCTPDGIGLAEKAAFETAQTKRCIDFDKARARAHERVADIPTPALNRLSEINKAGRIICRESLDGMTSEITGIVESLP